MILDRVIQARFNQGTVLRLQVGVKVHRFLGELVADLLGFIKFKPFEVVVVIFISVLFAQL